MVWSDPWVFQVSRHRDGERRDRSPVITLHARPDNHDTSFRLFIVDRVAGFPHGLQMFSRLRIRSK
jgi:hypothetical protein